MMIEKEKEKEKNADDCRKIKKGLIFFVASVAAAALVYITIKEGHRIKQENELLDYEVW